MCRSRPDANVKSSQREVLGLDLGPSQECLSLSLPVIGPSFITTRGNATGDARQKKICPRATGPDRF